MKKITYIVLLTSLLSACSLFGPQPTETSLVESTPMPTTPAPPTATPTPVPPTHTPTRTPTLTATPGYPARGYGPINFPDDVNPLTGLNVGELDLLERRPLAIKINIVPRTSTRPPWGLSAADIVYDYYQNNGYTRFHAIFLGADTELAGPIRSGRFPDHFLIRMYKSIFAYGSADQTINDRLLNAEYSDRLVLEGGRRTICPPSATAPLCRFDPQGYDFLLGGTTEIHEFVQSQGVDDERQDLDGMWFMLDEPAGGEAATQVTVRYSSDDYTRWEYNIARQKYLRYQDNVFDTGGGEEYAPLLDRNNEENIVADNVVVLLMEHTFFRKPPAEIIDILVSGSGPAYAFRDGKVYEVQWNIPAPDSVLYLTDENGDPFPFKPGKTWFQVVGQSSTLTTPEEGAWRFQFQIP
jgi:Protein of unknown function (DUF3048) C-terminal domain/Protein of unknown function (DUF3048) N-terminal domain